MDDLFVITRQNAMIFGLVAMLIIWIVKRRKSGAARIPNGPKGLPVFGSLFSIRTNTVQKLHYWAQQYGGWYSLWLGNQLYIVVSDDDVVKDLLVSRGAISSSRKEYLIAQTAMSGRAIITTPLNDLWREHRRIVQLALTPQAVHEYTASIESETRQLVRQILGQSMDSDYFKSNIDFFVLDCMLGLMLGTRELPMDGSRKHNLVNLVDELLYLMRPMYHLVDFVPGLQYIWRRDLVRARKARDNVTNSFREILRDFDASSALSQSPPKCFGMDIIQREKKGEISELDKIMLAASWIIGPQASIPPLLMYFVQVISGRSDVQERVHKELDDVVGQGRLPTVDDEYQLPYCRAFIKELERCKPSAVESPHLVTQDIDYQGTFIPKGAALLLNSFSINHESKRYPQPDEFDPTRHIKDFAACERPEKFAGPNSHDSWIFGTGRRICPAVVLSDRMVWLSISALLWAFEFTRMSPPEAPGSIEQVQVKATPRHDNIREALQELDL